MRFAARSENAPRRTRTFDPLIKSHGQSPPPNAANDCGKDGCATEDELVLEWFLA